MPQPWPEGDCLTCRLFVEIAPEMLGLIHVTELEPHKFASVSDYQVGDKVDAKVLEASLTSLSHDCKHGLRGTCASHSLDICFLELPL